MMCECKERRNKRDTVSSEKLYPGYRSCDQGFLGRETYPTQESINVIVSHLHSFRQRLVSSHFCPPVPRRSPRKIWKHNQKQVVRGLVVHRICRTTFLKSRRVRESPFWNLGTTTFIEGWTQNPSIKIQDRTSVPLKVCKVEETDLSDVGVCTVTFPHINTRGGGWLDSFRLSQRTTRRPSDLSEKTVPFQFYLKNFIIIQLVLLFFFR